MEHQRNCRTCWEVFVFVFLGHEVNGVVQRDKKQDLVVQTCIIIVKKDKTQPSPIHEQLPLGNRWRAVYCGVNTVVCRAGGYRRAVVVRMMTNL